MIEDLKADSARWDSERRAQTSRNTTGGIHTSRDASSVLPRQSSNSPAVQYRYSETHQSRQHHGPTDGAPVFQADPFGRDSGFDGSGAGAGPRYPGTGAPGYTGAAGVSYAQQQQQAYAAATGAAYGSYQQSQQSPPPQDPRVAAMNQGGYPSGQDPYITTGANSQRAGYGASPTDAFANRMSVTAAASQPSAYTTSGPVQPGYPAPASGYAYSSQVPVSGPPSSSYPQQAAQVQAQDPFFGRGMYGKTPPKSPPPSRPSPRRTRF